MHPLELASLQLTVGELPSEAIPMLAANLLVENHDTPALREAAGVSPRDTDKCRSLFRQALTELGYQELSERDAWWELAKWRAAQIVRGELDPVEGCNQLAYINRQMRNVPDLDVFIGIESCWPDLGDNEEYKRQVITEATALLGVVRPRRWIKLFPRSLGPFFGEHRDVDGTELWWDVDQSELAISSDLLERIRLWAVKVEDDLDEHGFPRFRSTAEAQRFMAEGNMLVDEVQKALGPDWVVEEYLTFTHPGGKKWEDQ